MTNTFKTTPPPLALILLCLLLFCACGQDPQGPSNKSDTGSYSPYLIFPQDNLENENPTKAIEGFDCTQNSVATIEFNFIVNEEQYSLPSFDCEEHHALITGIPVGDSITVEVFAEDATGTPQYKGRELNVKIVKDTTTPGGDIYMYPVFTNSFGMEFVLIAAGGESFIMGSPEDEYGRKSDEVQHEVSFSSDYYIQETEVTQDQWGKVVAAANTAGITTGLYASPSNFKNCGDTCPVEQVSWEDTQTFIEALNQLEEGTYALPTEAQWEYAARGGTESALPTGEVTIPGNCSWLDANLDRIGWYCGNAEVSYEGCFDSSIWDGFSCAGPHPVRELEMNGYGLYDMHGNVCEWCQDWYDDYPTGSVTDPQGPSTGADRVFRGGSWIADATGSRSAVRGGTDPSYRLNGFGFRLTVSLFSR